MLLHACLLLFIITTDKTQASSPHCGGNVSLEHEAAGLTLAGLYSDPTGLNRMSDKVVCTWIIDIPQDRTVHLKLVWLDSGSSISVLCVLTVGDRVLERGGTALLSGCDRNKATLSWTGAGNSSNAAQLVYRVQEDERNSLEDRSTHRPDQDLIRQSQTGTSFTRTAPVGQEMVRGTDGDGGHFFEGLGWSFGPQSMSTALSEDQGPQHPTLPQQSRPIAGRTDRETLPLPEEKPHNGADTSGAAHLTDSPMAARERTHPYFQHADTKSNTANPDGDTTVNGFLSTSTQTFKHTDQHIPTQTDRSVSESTASSSSDLPSWMSLESDTLLPPRGGAVSGTPGDKQPHSWRRQRSTDTLNSNLTSTTTSDPLQSSSKPPQPDSHSAHSADTEPTSSSSTQGPSRTQSSTTYITDLHTAVGTVEAASLHPNISQSDSFVSTAADVTAQTPELSEKFENTEMPQTVTSSTQSQTTSPPSTESLSWSPNTFSTFTQGNNKETQTATENTERDFMNAFTTIDTLTSTTEDEGTTRFSDSFSTPTTVLTTGGVVQSSATTTEMTTLSPTNTHSPTPVALLSSTPVDSSTPPYMLHTLSSHITSTSSITESTVHTAFMEHETTSMPSQTSRTPPTHANLPTSTNISPTHKRFHDFIITTHSSSLSTIKSDDRKVVVEEGDKLWSRSTTSTYTPTAGPPQHSSPRTALYPSQENSLAPSASTPSGSSTKSPKFYIMPDQPATIKVKSIELLLQIVLEEESRPAYTAGLEEDTAAWLEPYLQRAPGFSRLLGVWSSGHAVQSLVEFRTSGALQWLSTAGPTSLLEQSGLDQAVLEKRMFRSSQIVNITLGGLQGDVCDWLLQCPTGYICTSQPGTANYSCSSVCRFDYCHHHGICTHHVGQLPGCHCLVGEDFWYMGQRCDMRMTRARLVGACLGVLLIIVTVIGVLALVAVRRYRAVLIQAKVDQTRSSYRRFNHFDELSGRFWLRSWAGSADSLDNPAFTRSDELLHLRALDRTCCYHDDTLSLASTCPSHGTHINTIYPISSQYGWRGSEMSMGDGVLDSGKASDLSVCSWPVEPIHWTPFPLLQQLASHRTPTVRVSRPRSYCEGMELVDMGKSWTA
ncbi:mucin-22 [Parambassis ranga]|uniref:Mucin-22 n=1 Tax=Parambassis ranga TaxID=210632 RepID=A0A6P7JXJ8_9TELE|nr:mucin-22-like [Parambassis ranga]